jgi:UDP-glucose 4-epimerase
MGPDVDSPFTRLFTLPVVPTVLGHDARIQFVHVDDALEVLRRATLGDHHGVFNVSGPGVLLYSQAARRAGRPTAAIPAGAVSGVGSFLRRAGLVHLTDELVDYVTHGRVVDTARLTEVFGYLPRHSTAEAFDDFLSARGRGPLTAERIGVATDRTLGAIRAVTRLMPRPRLPGLSRA